MLLNLLPARPHRSGKKINKSGYNNNNNNNDGDHDGS